MIVHYTHIVTALVVNEGMISSDFPFDKCDIVVPSISRLMDILKECITDI